MAEANILLTRIDNRLVHGQVGVQWVGKVRPALIVMADDDAAQDKIQQQVMKITADMGHVGIRFFSLQQCVDTINKARADQTIFLICRNPHGVRVLVEGGVPIKELCVGNMHVAPGKKVYKDAHVYCDDADLADFEAIKSHGVKVYIEIAPGDHKIEL